MARAAARPELRSMDHQRFPFAVRSLCGRRPLNEDTAHAFRFPGGTILVLADGSGGRGGGDLASRAAVRAVCEAYRPRDVPAPGVEEAFGRAAEAVGGAVAAGEHPGAGTGLLLALLRPAGVELAALGPSGALLVRADGVRSLLEEPGAGSGLLGARLPPPPPTLRSFDAAEWSGEGGAILLLGSDGLLEAVSSDELLAIFTAAPDLENAIDRLVHRALELGSQENVSAAAAEIVPWPWRRRAPLWRRWLAGVGGVDGR